MTTSVDILPWPLTTEGDREHPVRTLQHLLRARGHGVAVDGVFGPRTAAAVRAFQGSRGLAGGRRRRPQNLARAGGAGAARRPR